MRLISCALALALVACRDADPPAPAPAVAQAPPRDPVLHAPHSRVIRLVAIADSGDAALSADDGDELRLWPSLDGKHEPVVVPGTAGKQIALGRVADGFVAAVLDASGGAEVLAFGPDGALRGRHALAVEPACDEVRVVGGRVLVRRRDQAIEWRDAAGVLKSRIAAPYGERLLTIATRHDRALVVFDPGGSDASHARWLEMREAGLAWGAEVEVPSAIVPPIGLSPNGQRLIGLKTNGDALLFDLASHKPTTLTFDVNGSVAVGTTAGFIDDDHAIYGAGGSLAFWSADGKPHASEQRHTRTQRDNTEVQAAASALVVPDSLVECDVGDGLIATALGAVLELRTSTKTRYLGYRFIGADVGVVAEGDRALITRGTKLAAVDRTLHAQQLLAVESDASVIGTPVALDEHRIAYAVKHAGDELVGILDLAGPHPDLVSPDIVLARYHGVGPIIWAPDAHVLSVIGDLELHRFSIDTKTWRYQALPTLPFPGGMIATLDPAHADGISVLIAFPFVSGQQTGKTRLFTYHEDGARMPASVKDVDGRVVHIARTGTVYAADAKRVFALRDGRPVWDAAVRHQVEAGAPSIDGSAFAYVGGGEVTVIDQRGGERWHQLIWKAKTVTWLDHDRTLIVATEGGLVAFDAASGARIATGCGWGFGLYDTAPAEQDFATPNVCQEPL